MERHEGQGWVPSGLWSHAPTLGSWLFALGCPDSGTQGSPEKNLARALVAEPVSVTITTPRLHSYVSWTLVFYSELA